MARCPIEDDTNSHIADGEEDEAPIRLIRALSQEMEKVRSQDR